MTTRFNSQSHRIGFINIPPENHKPSPVKIVKANPSDISRGLAAALPLESLGEVETAIANIPAAPCRPLRDEKNPGILGEEEIKKGIRLLQTCQGEHKKLWAVERKILLRFYNSKVHTHKSINLKSFQQFLVVTFDKTTAFQYLKELAVARKEELLSIPIGTYSIYIFKSLERFRCYTPIGSKRGEKGVFQSGSQNYGVKANPVEVARLRECWGIAKALAAPSMPEHKHILAAVEEMAQKYPEYGGRKEISSVAKWKKRALEAEALVEKLRQEIAQLLNQ
jgi:hypothetical protein